MAKYADSQLIKLFIQFFLACYVGKYILEATHKVQLKKSIHLNVGIF